MVILISLTISQDNNQSNNQEKNQYLITTFSLKTRASVMPLKRLLNQIMGT